ncbi:hypothetical protein C8R43DRAFT_989586 [Mycena crocata]|nr:hypothetical protein C8R43DRAFT_989586 [Mycena crocata]
MIVPDYFQSAQTNSSSYPTLDFATKKPADHLRSIVDGLGMLSYGQSEYVRQFGMATHRDGSRNMVNKKFCKPVSIDRWIMSSGPSAILTGLNQRCFNEDAAQDMINGLAGSCHDVGIKLAPSPFIFSEMVRAESDSLTLLSASATFAAPRGNDIYTSVKHFGDITVPLALKCLRAEPQDYANVCLKINVKLDRINTIPDPSSVSVLTDPHNPTIVTVRGSFQSFNFLILLTTVLESMQPMFVHSPFCFLR